jgi:serine/threonine protein kinase
MKRFGKYLLLDRISSGGMADVYRAKLVGIRGFSKTIAIKRIHPHLAERRRFLRMFTDEAKIASRLVHPNIVQIYDLGEEEGVPYIALEYVPGRDLFRVVKRLASKSLMCPWPLATRVAADVCAGLYYAHEFRTLDGQPQEIVHRDISPRNILISYSGEVKITDFGVARARDREEHTEHGVIKGKVRYISPEGALGERVDGRSDLYSLGVVLAELMTMEPFREAPNEMAMLLDVRHGRYDDSRIARLPEPIQKIIRRALEPDPNNRYPDADAFREDVLASLKGNLQPMTEAELAEFMQEVYSDEIKHEREGEILANSQVTDATPTLAGSTESIAAGANPLNVFSGSDGGHPLALNLPQGGRVRLPVQPTEVPPTPDLEGDLLEASVARLLHRLRQRGETGRLDLHREPVHKTLFLETGDPSFAVSNVEREFFGEYLIGRGALTRDQHGVVLDFAARQGLRFMEAALAQQVLAPNDIYRFLADQIRDRILELFSWTGGSYAFYRDVLAPEPGMPLNLRTHTLIHEGVQDRVPLVVIRRALEGVMRHRLHRTGGDLPSDLQLSGRQQRILHTIEADHPTPDELVKQERDEEAILRLIYLLDQIEHVEFKEPDTRDREL